MRAVSKRSRSMQIPDEQLRDEISEELDWDPRLDTSAVAVSATSGVITLF